MKKQETKIINNLHFNFLRNITIPGFYISDFDSCFSDYPQLINEHSFDFFSIIFFTSGKGNVVINNKKYPIKPFRLFLCHQKVEHSFDYNSEINGYYLFFCQDFYAAEFSIIRPLHLFSNSLPVLNRNNVPFIDITPVDNTISHIFDILCKESISRGINSNCEHIVRSYLNILILKLGELYFSNEANIHPEDSSKIILQLSHLIEVNFTQQQSCEFYAKMLSITENKLNDICRKNLNTGLKKILQERLIMEARKMIEQTDLSVAEIAYKLGFSDNSYFNKVFKNHTRLTPGRYRDIHKKIYHK